MVHGFVQQSGGRLEIESQPGRGTTVQMIFLKMTPEKDVSHMPQAQPDYQSRSVDQTPPPLILVIDDSEEIASMAGEALTDIGYRVTIAYSAEEVIEHYDQAMAANDPFCLMFSDVLMPGGANGLMLAEWVRERDSAMPVLLTTGYNDEMSLDGPRPGSLEVLGKPYKPSEMIDRVQVALRRGARTGPERATSDFGPDRE